MDAEAVASEIVSELEIVDIASERPVGWAALTGTGEVLVD